MLLILYYNIIFHRIILVEIYACVYSWNIVYDIYVDGVVILRYPLEVWQPFSMNCD